MEDKDYSNIYISGMHKAGYNEGENAGIKFVYFFNEFIHDKKYKEITNRAGFDHELLCAALAQLKTSKFLGCSNDGPYNIKAFWNLTDEQADFVIANCPDNLGGFAKGSMGHVTENVELTVLCLIQDGNKMLLQNRVKEDWKGYTFPGGHVEAGESFVDAVVREMKEETGLNITNPKLVGIKQFPITNGRYIVLLFKATEFSGTVISSDEGDMEWIDIDDISKVNVVEDFYDLLKVLNDPDINEFQYTIEDGEWIVHLK